MVLEHAPARGRCLPESPNLPIGSILRLDVPSPRAGLRIAARDGDTDTVMRLDFRLIAMVGVLVWSGCGWAVAVPRCDRGMARVDGQCVPTPTLVFRECVEAFRTTRVERDRGDSVAVGGSVPGTGSARLERDRRDVEAKELASLPDADADVIIEECRRQEQAERGRLLDEAWAAADEARGDAKRARNDVRRLESSTAALEGAVQELSADLELERATVLERDEALAAMTALASLDHPCALEIWPQCAEAAASDHEAGEHARAHRRYELACEAGVAEACGNWGLMFEHGQGVPTDLRRARDLYSRACDSDDLEGCVHLGVATLAEDGAVSDVEDGLRRACAKDVARGCTTLAQALPRGAEENDDIESLLEQACRLDDAHGCRLLGVHLERDVERGDLVAAQRAFDRACDLGDSAGCDARVQASATHRNPSGPKRVH